MSDLPCSWATARISDVFDKVVDGSHNPPPRTAIGRPMLSARNVLNNELDLEELRKISGADFDREDGRTNARVGDVLLTIVGSIGRSYTLQESDEQFTFQRSVAVLRPHSISPKYCAYQFQSPRFQHLLIDRARGTAQKGVYLKTLGSLILHIAPRNEQDRIVAEIEKQFSRLDAAIAALKRVQTNLKRHRASVLKAACEGRLVPTEAELARKEGREYESAGKLLERILRERRVRWEADTLAKMIASGKPPKNDRWKQKYKEPSGPNTAGLAALPEGWCWASADQVCSQITDGEHIQPPYTEIGYPLLTAKHVQDGYVDFRDFGRITEEHFAKARTRCAPTANDVLIVSVGATTGRAGIVRQEPAFAIVRSVLLLRSLVNPMYLLSWVQSPMCQDWIGYASGSTAQAHFYIGDAKRMPVALPPRVEQERILIERELRISRAEMLSSAATDGLKRAAGLRTAILKSAFTGKLTCQDPTDEHASLLLERIRTERAASGSGRSSRKRRVERVYA